MPGPSATQRLMRWWYSAGDLDARLDQVIARLGAIEGMLERMLTDADLNAALAALKSAIVEEVASAQTRVIADINALKAQIAAGGSVSQADLENIAQTQRDVIAAVQGIDPAPAPPPPTPCSTREARLSFPSWREHRPDLGWAT